jgi:transglutaminase-like putative cysteine protease
MDDPSISAGSRPRKGTTRTPPAVRIRLGVDLSYRIAGSGADFVFNIHPAITSCQKVSSERLRISQPVVPEIHTDACTGNRYMRLHALPGELTVSYQGTVDLRHHRAEPHGLREIPIHQLPHESLGYIYPSRYCESDKLHRAALRLFGQLPAGYPRVQAIMDWVERQIAYTPNISDTSTSAVDTFVQQAGVCRDFAHLMIALCRAVNIPARFATGTDFGADELAREPDFHAYVEVYVENRWFIFDPSKRGIPMGFVRIGTGRDAADVAFATIFGDVTPTSRPIVRASAVSAARFTRPQHTDLALSTA